MSTHGRDDTQSCYVGTAQTCFDQACSLQNVLQQLRPSPCRALSALRAFRVLRLIKMFRYIKSLRRIGTVLISSMTSFAAIVVLIVLFWVVFAVVGQHVFGGLILTYYPFPNYNTFFNALVATFNVSCMGMDCTCLGGCTCVGGSCMKCCHGLT